MPRSMKWGAAAAVALGVGLCLALWGSPAGAAPRELPPNCAIYTPSALALNKTSVEPGESAILSGDAIEGDVVTFSISGSGVTTTSLGQGTIGASNSFSKSFTVPDSFPAGTYTITARSKTCSRNGTISISLISVNRSGCASGNPLTLVRGATTNWKLVNTTPPFATTQPVTLTLTRRTIGGVSYTLYSGAWPASNTKLITVPGAAPLDQYYLTQSGKRLTTLANISVSCPVRVTDPPAAPSNAAPILPARLAAVGVSAYLLVRLRRRRSSRRTVTA